LYKLFKPIQKRPAIIRGKGSEVEIEFFRKTGCWFCEDALAMEYCRQGLTPVDLLSLATANETDPLFANKYPNATHWKNEEGKWCVAMFPGTNGKTPITVSSDESSQQVWRDHFYFAGIRKK
jgi:hypothetical protein